MPKQQQPQHIKDLTPDPRNARRHTPRNVGMIEDALHEVGAARPIVIDEAGVVLAGNATLEAAGAAGITRVQVVDADGQTIVAVRRKGLTARQKQRLALFDNRTAELAEWDNAQLEAMLKEDPKIADGMFRDDELEATVGQTENESTTEETENMQPIKKMHILISASAEDGMQMLGQIELIAKKHKGEVVHAGN